MSSVARHRLSRQEVAKLPVASPAELLLAEQLRQAGIPFEREYRFDPDRKFRADFMVHGQYRKVYGVPLDILIEVNGGTWSSGRHNRGSSIEAEYEKLALAAIRGYRVIACTTEQVNDGRALAWVRAALGLEAA